MLVAVGNQENVSALETWHRLHSRASNSRINRHNSKVVRLNEADLNLPFKMMRPGQSVRYLGIYFKDGAIDACLQYEILISTMKQRINSWKDKDLSLHSRVLCLNVFALSRLGFAAHVVPIEKHVSQQGNELSRDFLWQQRRGHVSLQRVQRPPSQGGVGLYHVEY
jgi:hypothetical protein